MPQWLRDYAIPIAVTSVLHLVLLAWLALDFSSTSHEPLVKQPKHIKASLVQIKDKKKPKAKPKKPKKEPVKKQPKKDDKKKKEAAAKKKAQEQEKIKKQQAEKLKKEKLLEEKQRQEQKRLEEEQRRLEEQTNRENDLLNMMEEEDLEEASAADEVTAMSYMSVVKAAIESNWSRPPSARNGMQVILAIQLVPTGDVVNVDVAQSSGNEAFDRSALVAVDKTEGFPELAELEPHVFEQYYRRFKLVFKPEDLRL